jgi:hypothetical protein
MGNTITCNESSLGKELACSSNTIVLSNTDFKKTFYQTCEHLVSNIMFSSKKTFHTLDQSIDKLRGLELVFKKVMIFNDKEKKSYSISYDMFIRLVIMYSQLHNKFNMEKVLFDKINSGSSCFRNMRIKNNMVIYDNNKVDYNNKQIPSIEQPEFKNFSKSFLYNYKICNYGLIKVCINNNKHHDSFILCENNNNKLSLTYYNTFIDQDKDLAFETINYMHETLKLSNNKLKIFEDISLSVRDECKTTQVSSSLCVITKLFWLYSVGFIVNTFTEKHIYMPHSSIWLKYLDNYMESFNSQDYFDIIIYFMGYLFCSYQNDYNLSKELAGDDFASFVEGNMTSGEKELYKTVYVEAPFEKQKYYEHILCLKDAEFRYDTKKTNGKKLFDICNMNYDLEECDSEIYNY